MVDLAQLESLNPGVYTIDTKDFDIHETKLNYEFYPKWSCKSSTLMDALNHLKSRTESWYGRNLMFGRMEVHSITLVITESGINIRLNHILIKVSQLNKLYNKFS